MRSNKRKGGKPNHIITAWGREDGFSLGQKVVNAKNNEITAIPKLLGKIRIKGHVVTIDAMGTQTAIAEKIRSKRGDYALALKENQKNLYEDVRLFLDEEPEKKKLRENGKYKKQWKRHISGYQLKLPLNIETIIPEDDSVRLLSQFVEAMDLQAKPFLLTAQKSKQPQKNTLLSGRRP